MRLLSLFCVFALSCTFTFSQSPQATPAVEEPDSQRQVPVSTPLYGRQPSSSPPSATPTQAGPSTSSTAVYGRTAAENLLGLAILMFGLIVIFLEMALMAIQRKGWGIQSTRIVGITLIVTIGAFLIVAGYSQEQISPMIGLLGTIVGFLLGKSSSNGDKASTPTAGAGTPG